MSNATSTIRNIARVALAKVFSLATILVMSIVVARATSPEAFGMYSVAIAIIVLYDALLGAPFDNAVVRYSSLHGQHKNKVERVQGLVFRLKVLLSLFIVLASIMYADAMSSLLFGINAPDGILLITLFSAISMLILRSSASYLQINHKFTDYSNLDIGLGFGRITLVIILFLNGSQSVNAYLSAYGISSLIIFLVYLFIEKQTFFLASMPSKSECKKIASYIGVTSLIVILGTITGRADIPLLSIKSTPADVGYYSVAVQLSIIGTLFASYAAIVFQPSVIRLAKENKLNALINKNIALGAGLSLVAIPVSIYIVPVLIPFFFGDHYINSVVIFQILLIGICADLIIMPILMPYALQALPATILSGEVILTAGFIVFVLISNDITPELMAWTVSAIRVLKLLLYYTTVRLSISQPSKLVVLEM